MKKRLISFYHGLRPFHHIVKVQNKIINQVYTGLHQNNRCGPFDAYRTSVKTLKKHLPYIGNSLTHPYNNGQIEGINNKIKVFNCVAYGYRTFDNFKNIIILHFKVRETINKQKQSVYPAA